MFNAVFFRNLTTTAIFVMLVSLGLAEIQDRRETFEKRQKFSPLNQAMRIGIVLKAQQIPRYSSEH